MMQRKGGTNLIQYLLLKLVIKRFVHFHMLSSYVIKTIIIILVLP